MVYRASLQCYYILVHHCFLMAFENIFFCFMCMCFLSACVCAPYVCLVTMEAKRGCWTPWIWSNGWLWATLSSLESSLSPLLGHLSSPWFCVDKRYLTLWSTCLLPEFFSFWKESQWNTCSDRMKAFQVRKLVLICTSFLCILMFLCSQLQTRSIF